jgi:hypothetical protein
MAIDRKKVVYSLCVEDIITSLEDNFDIKFDSLKEEQQEELIRLGQKAFENGLNWDETCMYGIEEYLTELCLIEE